ncbi:hypothetical protein [Lactiplantibacillus plantarum]|uniref:hypothetical protein n=1 Tax=Lactiplantibacillus plantarum TaxID=1590 RepID=UPI000C7EA060|nr:hypothetical protein [Lactiplantibacillus plantarum]
MAKTLEFTTKSPRQIKQGDTETTFTFICKSSGSDVDLTQATNITAKIGNASGYLRSQPIAVASLAGLKPGWINFQPTPALIADLPDGDYQLEIWVTDQAGTSIYPSDKPLDFTITNNIESESGASITTIAFDDFVEAMNKAASTIAKGDPGEGLDIKGQVTSVSALPTTANEGNGYLVNEELYVYTSGVWKDCGPIQGPQGIQGKTGTGISSTTIQYQISNSATTAPTGIWSNNIVATTITNPYLWMKATLNYTDGTTKDFYLVSQKGDKGDKGDTGTVDNAGLISAPAFQNLQTQVNNSAVGTNLIAQSDLKGGYLNPDTGEVTPNGNYDFYVESYIPTNGSTVFTLSSPDYVFKGSTSDSLAMYDSSKNFLGRQSITSATQTLSKPNVAYIRLSINFVVEGGIADHLSDWLDNHRYKLEKGSVATDWCLNPTEILTQSDYAKIKAAIVALGGLCHEF